jgi:hypothetical protein
MNRSLGAILVALILATAPATGQDAGNLAGVRSPGQVSLESVDRRLVSRFPASVATRIGTLVDSASAEGLPTEPLILRALEGGAKRVPADRIYTAVSRLRDAIGRARRTLGAEATAGDLTTAAAALQVGVAPTKLLELKGLRRGSSLTVPLGAYLDLVARGAVNERAWERVISLARRDASDREYGSIDPSDLIARQPGDRR